MQGDATQQFFRRIWEDINNMTRDHSCIVSGEDFRASLVALKHTQRSFAAYVGVDERSVGRWARGEQGIPQWVGVVLKLMEQVRQSP